MKNIPNFQHELQLARRPHTVASSGLGGVRLVIVSHTPPIAPGSEIGLGVIVASATRVLRRAGVDCILIRASNVEAVAQWLEDDHWKSPRRVTHVCINTYGFMSAGDVGQLASRFVDIEFFVVNHSAQSFLQIDPQAIDNICQLLTLQATTHNVRLAGNHPYFVSFCADSFGAQALLLPNLYDTEGFTINPTSRRDPDPLRIGTFGALRDGKNQFVAQQAALGMARRLRVHLEWHVNGNGNAPAKPMVRARQRLYANVPWAMMIEHPMTAWHEFLKAVEDMDLLVMPSFYETFCCVVADGIRMGVPSVVTSAMEWAPRSWVCHDPSDPAAVMRVGLALLHDRSGAVHDGRVALEAYLQNALRCWIDYLTKGILT